MWGKTREMRDHATDLSALVRLFQPDLSGGNVYLSRRCSVRAPFLAESKPGLGQRGLALADRSRTTRIAGPNAPDGSGGCHQPLAQETPAAFRAKLCETPTRAGDAGNV